ncbi:MAG: hypothetical protein WC381_07220 [Kiritimatiellia bacterium]
MNVKACLPYRSKMIRKTWLRLPDNRSVFKLYFFSLIGRDEPERYEWERSTLTPAAFEANLRQMAPEGIGFITAFPHLTKVFRFAPAAETILHVRAFRTRDLTPLDLGREDNYMEFACYAEAVIAAYEYRQWAGAGTVPDYLRTLSDFPDGPVASHTKLGEYLNASN